jgi:hypothetical protein
MRVTAGPRSALGAILAAVAAGCAQTPPQPAAAQVAAQPAAAAARPQASAAPMASRGLVKNADFEADPAPGRRCPPSWGCAAHSNADSYAFELASDSRSRGRYLKLTRVLPEPWGMAIQPLPAGEVAGKRLRVSVSVLGESLEGGAGPLIILHGQGGRVLDHRKALLTRGPGWRRASVEIDVVPGTQRVECGLVVEGAGWAGFDDVEVAVLPREGA